MNFRIEGNEVIFDMTDAERDAVYKIADRAA